MGPTPDVPAEDTDPSLLLRRYGTPTETILSSTPLLIVELQGMSEILFFLLLGAPQRVFFPREEEHTKYRQHSEGPRGKIRN